MPPAAGQEEPIKRITKIVNSLLANQDCAPFREPVDWRGLELFDYPQIITKMMDLGTIKRRLERGNYSTTHQVAEDIRLVWKNCMSYNADGSDFWLLAKSYARRFEDRYRKIRQEYDVGEGIDGKDKEKGSTPKSSSKSSNNNSNSNKAEISSPASVTLPTEKPTLDARARFGSNLFLLSGVELGHIITTCELDCPEALETCGNDRNKIEINVDAIPTDIFANLNTYVTQKVGQKDKRDAASPSSDTGGGSNKKRKQRK